MSNATSILSLILLVLWTNISPEWDNKLGEQLFEKEILNENKEFVKRSNEYKEIIKKLNEIL